MAIATHAEALSLVESWTASDSLRKHVLAVECALRAYAQRFGENVERWGVTGLLHDFGYERYPNADQRADEEHPAEGVRYLRSQGEDEEMCQAILGQAHYTGVGRETRLAKTLFVCDEHISFVLAAMRAASSSLGLDGRLAQGSTSSIASTPPRGGA